MLSDPAVQVAVLETARGGLLRAGMAMRHVDVGAVLNIQPDHLGQKGIETLEQLAEVKRTVVEIATDTAVLNADDPHTLRMAAHTKAKHLCYVTMDPAHDLVREHIRAGGRAIALEAGVNGQMITLYDRGAHIPLLWTHLIPATLEGRATFNVQNAMFAAAMAFSMGVRLEDIRHGLRTFDTTFFQAPGRLNVYDEHPFKVLFDYGHNAHAVAALCDLVHRMKPVGRRICVLSAPGDRRDDDIRAIATVAAAGAFEHYVVRRDDALRGRRSDEVPRLLQETLLGHGITADRISVIVDEQEAIEAALRMARAGDLLLVFADALARGWKQIINFRPEAEQLVIPPPRAARAVPRAEVSEDSPADDVAPARSTAAPATTTAPPARWNSTTDDVVLMRSERGVMLVPEASD